MKRILLTCTLWSSCLGHAQGVSNALKSITEARREVIAVLPKVGRQDMAIALKQAATRGTKVFLITERASVKKGGYLLNVSHGPESIYTYLYPATLPEAWVMVDGAWYVTGPGLDMEGTLPITLSQDSAKRQQLLKWAAAITKKGPVPRVELLKLRFQK